VLNKQLLNKQDNPMIEGARHVGEVICRVKEKTSFTNNSVIFCKSLSFSCISGAFRNGAGKSQNNS
jgi:hypothetical protein